MARKRIVPEAEIVTAETHYGAAYAWKCSGYGLEILGDTKKEAESEFPKAFKREYEKEF